MGGGGSAYALSREREAPATNPVTDPATAGPPLAEARAAVILLHGRGASAPSILGLGRELGPDLALLAPQAPPIGGVPQWYPHSFLAPNEANEPHLGRALDAVAAAVAHAEAALPRARIAIGGFSQGACLGLEHLARTGGRWAAAFALSGGLIGTGPGPDATPGLRGAGGLYPDKAFAYGTRLDGTPVFLGCGDPDPHIPAARVRRSAEVLAELGADVDARLYPGLGHTVSHDELDAVRALLADDGS